MTMTRLYTQDFKCEICLQIPSIGWLWRCSQDRELMLEHALERGYLVGTNQAV